MASTTDNEELYHPDLLALAGDHPRFRTGHEAMYMIKAYNPLCGDKFEIRIDVHTVITDTSFYGFGCVVSKASTAVLTDMLIGKTLTEAYDLIRDYLEAFHSENTAVDHRLKHFTVARKYPGRIQCATLSWEAVQKGIKMKTE